MISYGRQSIDQNDIDAVIEVLKSDFLTQGPKVVEFEKDLSSYCRSKYSKVVCNGTAALHLAYLAVGLKKGDLFWTVPNTFVATANAALYCGANVDFVDIDPDTYNMSVDCLEKKLVQAKNNNNLPKLVVPVHFSGQSCQMKEIWELSQEYGFKVVEDACHALGSDYKNNKVGSCEYSDMAVFSFHPVKMITTGEGAAIMTNSKSLNDKVDLLRSHGITKDPEKFINQSDGDWYYEQQILGFNYRLSDIQAALGISQLKKLDDFIAIRRRIARRYLQELENVDLPVQHSDSNSSWHLFVIRADNRKKTFQQLKEHSIMAQVHYIPITKQPFYNAKALKNSECFFQHCLSLPIYVDLTNDEQTQVIRCL